MALPWQLQKTFFTLTLGTARSYRTRFLLLDCGSVCKSNRHVGSCEEILCAGDEGEGGERID